MSDDNAPLAIGELARRAGTATSALRYYERIGLLPPAERAGGKRHYPPSSAERLALVRLYQDAGFTLNEILQLLAADGRGRASWNLLAERKVAELACPHGDLLTCPRFRAALQARLEAPLQAAH